MKREELLRHLRKHECELLREGSTELPESRDIDSMAADAAMSREVDV